VQAEARVEHAVASFEEFLKTLREQEPETDRRELAGWTAAIHRTHWEFVLCVPGEDLGCRTDRFGRYRPEGILQVSPAILDFIGNTEDDDRTKVAISTTVSWPGYPRGFAPE